MSSLHPHHSALKWLLPLSVQVSSGPAFLWVLLRNPQGRRGKEKGPEPFLSKVSLKISKGRGDGKDPQMGGILIRPHFTSESSKVKNKKQPDAPERCVKCPIYREQDHDFPVKSRKRWASVPQFPFQPMFQRKSSGEYVFSIKNGWGLSRESVRWQAGVSRQT